MKKTAGFFVSLFAAGIFLFGPAAQGTVWAADKTAFRVSAAISMKDAISALRDMYTRKNPTVEVLVNFGSSGLLQKQIEEGAPVDLFISAGKKQMDDLAAKRLIVPETRFDLLGNEIVLVVANEKKGVIKTFEDLTDKAKSMSIGQPETVPAGKYGKETLTSLKLWDRVKGKVMFAKDVRQVLAYVESGNVDAGLVYVTDTVVMKSGVVVATAPKGSHSPILYPMAIIKDGKNRDAAKKFMEFLKSAEAAKVFATYKFIPLTARK
jgi:molybdate transport system substrate-binding protein